MMTYEMHQSVIDSLASIARSLEIIARRVSPEAYPAVVAPQPGASPAIAAPAQAAVATASAPASGTGTGGVYKTLEEAMRATGSPAPGAPGAGNGR